MYNYNKVVLSIFQIVSKQGTGIQLTSLSISTFFSCYYSSFTYHLLESFPVKGKASESNPGDHKVVSLISVPDGLDEMSLMLGTMSYLI